MRLRIAKMAYSGEGVADPTQSDVLGESILVPFTLPGEIVRTRGAQSNGGTIQASLLQVITPSESRVKPECIHFGECGGCQYQHASYRAQAAIKKAVLRELLKQAGLSALPAIQAHRGDPWKYRNRSRLRVERHNGELRVGYNRRGSNEFLPIRECPISAALIWHASEALLRVFGENTAAGRWSQSAAEVEFFVSGDEKKLQMTVFVRKDQAGFNVFCERMKDLLSELTGAGSAVLPAGGPQRRAQKARPLSSWGAAGLSYRVADEEYWVSRGGFFQVNRFLLEELIAVVTNGRRGLVAWDLYAGGGLFSRVLARNFDRVVAVEAVGDDLIKTFKGTGRHAVKAATAEFLRGAVIQRERPELIVVDPPRAGIGDEACALLARISAPEIVYVSCDPVTLARDLKTLVGSGYQLADLHMVDLFPQTFHLETVAVLRK